MTDFVTSAAGDRIDFDSYGAGPALIFVAGAGPSRATDSVTPATARLVAESGIRTIFYDRLGRGDSPARGALTLDREVSALAALIAEVGGSAVLDGHSSGCSIALAAATRGLAVDGLVLWEAPFAVPARGAQQWSDRISELIDAGDLEGAQVEYMRDMPPEWLEGARNSPAWPSIYAQVGSLRADAESLAWAESAPHAELFGSLTVPVEVLIGKQSQPIMQSAAASIAAAIPGASWKRMPGANHSWEVEPMAAELVRFMRAA